MRFYLMGPLPQTPNFLRKFQLRKGNHMDDIKYLDTVMQKYGHHVFDMFNAALKNLDNNGQWGQIWGYVESRPTSVPDETRNAIKLQFRNQFQISYDMI